MSQTAVEKVSASREFKADVDAVWDVVSDLDREQRIWGNLRDVKVIRREGNTVERDANVGPRAFSQRSHQTLVFDPKKSISLTIDAEALDGDRSIVLTPLDGRRTRVDVTWKLRTKGVPGFVVGIVKGQIAKATEDALVRVAEEVEEGAN